MCTQQQYYSSHLPLDDVKHGGEAHASLLRHHEALAADSVSVSVGRYRHTDDLGADLLPADRKRPDHKHEHRRRKRGQGGASYLRYSGVHLDRAGQWLKAFLMMQGLFGPIQSR